MCACQFEKRLSAMRHSHSSARLMKFKRPVTRSEDTVEWLVHTPKRRPGHLQTLAESNCMYSGLVLRQPWDLDKAEARIQGGYAITRPSRRGRCTLVTKTLFRVTTNHSNYSSDFTCRKISHGHSGSRSPLRRLGPVIGPCFIE